MVKLAFHLQRVCVQMPNQPESTIDINLAEYQYIADRLTEEECRRLVAALHFPSFDLPKGLNAAERRLPQDVSCVDLLLHWNSTPGEGKGETHVRVCHRLIQLGRGDLANWLSKTVFHQLSKDVKLSLNSCRPEETTLQSYKTSEVYPDEGFLDEAAWWTLDTLLSILLVFGLITLITGGFYLCYLCLAKRSEKPQRGYKKLSTRKK